MKKRGRNRNCKKPLFVYGLERINNGIVPANDICVRLVCHLSTFHVMKLFRCYLVRQWAAVSSHWSLIRLPPQKWWPWLVWRDTCHGQRFRAASVPPTIKGPGMGPLSPSNPPMCSGTVNVIVALNIILALNFSTILADNFEHFSYVMI